MQRYKGIGSYGTVGLDMVLAVVLGFLAGRWVDHKVGAHGWLTAAGFVLGVAAAFNILFKTARKLREDTEREDREQQREPKSDKDEHDDQH
jgi:ATP synthase protein I